MRDLMIGKDVTYGLSTASGSIAGSWASHLLTEGAISVQDYAGTHIAYNISAAITSPYITIMLKTPNGVKTSFPIWKDGFSYSKQVYVAPVAAIKVLGNDDTRGSLNLPSSLVVGTTVGVGIVDLSKSMEDTRRYKEYSFTVLSGDLLTGLTTRNIIQKLIVIINADPNRVVNAVIVDDATDATGITFTAITAGNDFNIYNIEGVLQSADVVSYKMLNNTYTASITTPEVANVTGSGTAAQILKEWNATKSRDGNQGYMKFGDLLYSDTTNYSSTATYTTYRLTTKPPNTDEISVQNNPAMDLIIAVPSGATGGQKVIAALDTILSYL
jgi:hypothetical protein